MGSKGEARRLAGSLLEGLQQGEGPAAAQVCSRGGGPAGQILGGFLPPSEHNGAIVGNGSLPNMCTPGFAELIVLMGGVNGGRTH